MAGYTMTDDQRSKDARAALAAAVEMYGDRYKTRALGEKMLLEYADEFLKWLDKKNGRI